MKDFNGNEPKSVDEDLELLELEEPSEEVEEPDEKLGEDCINCLAKNHKGSEIPFILLDSSLRTVTENSSFRELFGISPSEGRHHISRAFPLIREENLLLFRGRLNQKKQAIPRAEGLNPIQR